MISPLVFISYNDQNRSASIRVEGCERAWQAIRRVCQDTIGDVDLTGANSLSLPWWALLGCLDEIEYHVRRNRASIVFQGDVESRLNASRAAVAAYEKAKSLGGLSREEVSDRLLEGGFERSLTDEQIRNVCKIAALPAAATFSVPGAGKTTEALAFFRLRRTQKSKLLVICPKNAFAAWEEQVGICLPDDSSFVRLTGGRSAIEQVLKGSPEKVLITYQQLPNVLDLIARYLDDSDSFIFLDESHRMKRGFDGVIGNAILSIAQLPSSKLIMSGTPIPNDISDLVPQFRFLYPEIIADSESVESYIKPVYVRTTKSELGLKKPQKTIKRIPLKPAQYELYSLLRSESARQAKNNLTRVDIATLRKAGRSALRLLQLATNPSLLARMNFEHEALLGEVLSEGDSPKLEYACYRARELAYSGHKSIIWSSFVQNVELVSNRLVDLGAEFIHGGVDAGSELDEGTREQKIKRFHDDENCWVMVANPAACGEGISLHTVCHHAIYLDRNYNAAQYLQSEDRIHRLGLPPEQETFVEILQAPGTIDESVDRRLSHKIDKMAQVLNDEALKVEPEVVDLDADGFNEGDLTDFLQHLRERVD